MGKPGAFLEHGRCAHSLRPVQERARDFDELYEPMPEERTREQASRCMACGVAFCQVGAPFGKARPSGCPLHNLIPEWNDLVWRGQWEQAAERLALTSPMPEFTSRVCPALCEAACNLARNDEAETIHDNEPSPIGSGRTAGRVASSRRARTRRASPWSVRVRRAWWPRGIWRAAGRACAWSSAMTAPAACSCTASRT